MSDGSGGITGAFKDEISETVKEVKQQVIGSGGNQKKSTNQHLDPKLAQLTQQDKIESSHKQKEIQNELASMIAMKNHTEASNLGVIRETRQPQSEEVQSQKSTMPAPVLPGSKNRDPFDVRLATTKRESRDSKAVG